MKWPSPDSQKDRDMGERFNQATVDRVHDLKNSGSNYKTISRLMGWGKNTDRVKYIIRRRNPTPKSLFSRIRDLFTRE